MKRKEVSHRPIAKLYPSDRSAGCVNLCVTCAAFFICNRAMYSFFQCTIRLPVVVVVIWPAVGVAAGVFAVCVPMR